jgi:hypothetical protein
MRKVIRTSRDVPPMGCGGCGVRNPPRSENFQFFPAKIVYFIEKKDCKMGKKGLARPSLLKNYI